jgi:hypothetical protein
VGEEQIVFVAPFPAKDTKSQEREGGEFLYCTCPVLLGKKYTKQTPGLIKKLRRRLIATRRRGKCLS